MKLHYDRWILVSTLSLLMLGLLMVASTSMVVSDRQYGYPFHYLFHQTAYLLMGLVLMWGITRLPIYFWQKTAIYLLLISFLLLIVVLIPGIGKMVNGSRRWINLGVLSVQVSELVKLFLLIYLSSYLERYQNQIRDELKGFIKPVILLMLIAILLLMQPDFGAVAVLTMTFLVLLFIAGVRLWPFCVLFLLLVAALGVLAVVSPYRMERLTTFLNPWSTQFGSGYQLTQSLIAFGRGGLFGVGLGNSIQKLYYLPEAYTDFLFAILGEELGLVGELIVIALFAILVGRIFVLGWRAHMTNKLFSAYMAYGLGLWIALQSMINIGVNTGVLPTKGLTLPLISYGGSSLLVNCMVVGIVLRIANEIPITSIASSRGSKITHYRKRVAR